ncbi:MAG: Papain family cysteine protease [Armatimonadetes bacterium]|jgi:hypothetical protein|nr:Papain family cysteine protease [Armatimonadota bacterium]
MRAVLVTSSFAIGLLCLPILPVAGVAAPTAGFEQRPEARPSVDLRPQLTKWGLETRPQGSRGTCSVFAMVGAIEFATAAKQGRGTPLSVEFLNWAAHRAVRRRADGGFFSEIWQGYEKFGICPEEALPYRPAFDPELLPQVSAVRKAQEARSLGLRMQWIKEWDVRTGLTDAQLAGVRATLASGSPVCAGLRWPKRERWDAGVLRMCEPDAVFDGHSVLLVGYRDDSTQPGGGVFLIRNSSGPSRDGALPYAYVRAYANDAAWVE